MSVMAKNLRLVAGQHTCLGALDPEATSSSDSESVLERQALLVYVGKFESMDGPVEITEDHINLLMANHNARIQKATVNGVIQMKSVPPLQLDHSSSAVVTVGRVPGELYTGDHTNEEGNTVVGLYTKAVRTLGKENVEKVKDGRWCNISIGADLEAGTFSELSITPFPAAANASILSKCRMAKTIYTHKINGKNLSITLTDGNLATAKIKINTIDYGVCPLSKKPTDETIDELVPEIEKHLKITLKAISKGATMYKRLMAFLMGTKKLSEKEANEKLAEMDDKEKAKLAEEADAKKEKMKKHLMDKEKLSDHDADDKLSKMNEEESSKLAAEVDEKEKKMAADEEEKKKLASDEAKKAGDEAKMAAKTSFIALAKGIKSTADSIHLAGKTANIHARLSKLRSEAKITPAEIKKQDITKLAASSEAEIEAMLKGFESREPVIDRGVYGTAKAVNLSKIHQKYRTARLELESRLNMPMKAKDAKAKLAKLSADEHEEIRAAEKEQEANPVKEVMSDSKMAYDAVCKMIDEGHDKERIKDALKKLMDANEKEMGGEASGSEKQMSALVDNVKTLQTQFKELVTLAGSSLGVDSKEL